MCSCVQSSGANGQKKSEPLWPTERDGVGLTDTRSGRLPAEDDDAELSTSLAANSVGKQSRHIDSFVKNRLYFFTFHLFILDMRAGFLRANSDA